jgi:hypothetical protein
MDRRLSARLHSMTPEVKRSRRRTTALAALLLAFLFISGQLHAAAHVHHDDSEDGSSCASCRQIESTKLAPETATALAVFEAAAIGRVHAVVEAVFEDAAEEVLRARGPPLRS